MSLIFGDPYSMELMKHSPILTIFLLLLLTTPYFATGGEVSAEMVDNTTEVYEIDYKGPETHSSIPPPGHLHGKKKPLPIVIHNESIVIGSTPKSKNSGGNYNMGRKAKNIHG